jgi:DNA-binding transcriptional ArsR family regulator
MIAALIGNPASAHMLMALMAGPALTSTELAHEAGLTLATTSGHLARLEEAGLVARERQGRHRYYRLTDGAVARAIESLMPLAERAGHLRTRLGPRDPGLRYARSCYDHLAGRLAVEVYDALIARKFLRRAGEDVAVTEEGRAFFRDENIPVDALELGRRPLCRPCLDWSERRIHLAGALGAEIFEFFKAHHWVSTQRGDRVVRFSRDGERRIRAWCSSAQPAETKAS